jgi:hypothetical protein
MSATDHVMLAEGSQRIFSQDVYPRRRPGGTTPSCHTGVTAPMSPRTRGLIYAKTRRQDQVLDRARSFGFIAVTNGRIPLPTVQYMLCRAVSVTCEEGRLCGELR